MWRRWEKHVESKRLDPFAAYVIRGHEVHKVVVNPFKRVVIDYWCTAADGSFQEQRPLNDYFMRESDALKALDKEVPQ